MKKILSILLIVIIGLVSLLLFRAQTYFVDSQVNVAPSQPTLPADPSAAVERFAKGIQFKTISYDDMSKLDPRAFIDMREHIETSFPLVHANSQRLQFSEHSLLYHFEGSNQQLNPALFMGHLDVVPVDEVTLSQWQQPPFSGAIVDDIVWGRGTIDDKVTVFALLEAMEMMLQQGIAMERSIYFAFGHDEEVGGKLGAVKIAEHFKKQGVEFEFVLDEGGAITEGIMKGVSQPVAMIGVAEKGFVNVRLTVDAAGGHSSQPPKNTALGILSQAIVKVEQSEFETDLSHSGKTFDAVGHYAPLSARLPMANLWLLEPVVTNVMLETPSSAAGIKTTIAATMASGSSKSNILPTQANAVVNVRILPGDSIASVTQHFRDVINDDRVKVDTFMGFEPSAVSPTDSQGYQLIEKHIRRLNSDVLVAPYLVVGGTDSRHFYGLSDNIYRFMMVRLDAQSLKRFHGINEQLPVNDYLNAIAFFYDMLKETAKG